MADDGRGHSAGARRGGRRLDLFSAEGRRDLYRLADGRRNAEGAPTAEVVFARTLAHSRSVAHRFPRPVKVAVVFAMWMEHERLKPKSGENGGGEDSLRRKVEELRWALDGSPVSWHLYAVDDGCPRQSGVIARQLVETLSTKDRERISVLFLEQALPTSRNPLSRLETGADSQKAGGIVLGCLRAIEEGADYVMYTDCDMSACLSQIGVLLEAVIDPSVGAVLGNRYDSRAILIRNDQLPYHGFKFIRHIQKLLSAPIAQNGIFDTQAGFKLFSSPAIKTAISEMVSLDFSFDTDIIMSLIKHRVNIKVVPFHFVHSFEQSTVSWIGLSKVYEKILKGLINQSISHGMPIDREICQIILKEITDFTVVERLLRVCPPQLSDVEETLVGRTSVMTPTEVEAWIRHVKNLAS